MRLFRSILPLWIALLAAAPSAQARDLAGVSSTEITTLQQRLADGGCYQCAIDGQARPSLQAAIEACPSQDPILRIETGMHVADILRIGVDRACRIAATASDDKTVRIWSLPEGRRAMGYYAREFCLHFRRCHRRLCRPRRSVRQCHQSSHVFA
jgi:hypothetical protein